jgi:bidirectional [NiFe] hydrogenase diaphorase subunit
MVRLIIDGTRLQAGAGATILEAAQQAGIWIPTLCHHEALTPYGGCRLCAVEVKEGGATRIVSSCAYTVAEGIEVSTTSDTILELRRFMLSLLLAEAPEAQVLQALAAELGAMPITRFTPRNELCIACGRCIRACRELAGVSAIDFAARGYEKKAATPFFERSDCCIGCGTCVAVCPTGAITMKDVPEGETAAIPGGGEIAGPARIMENWKTGLACKRCAKCGEPFAPRVQLEYFTRRASLAADFFEVCLNCRAMT